MCTLRGIQVGRVCANDFVCGDSRQGIVAAEVVCSEEWVGEGV